MRWSRKNADASRRAAPPPPSRWRRPVSFLVTTAATMALLVLAAPAALAAPSNDDIGSAVTITSVPYTTTEDTSQATFDPSDPTDCSSNGSVWYAYTPQTSGTLVADTFGSDYDTVLSAWTGSPGSLNVVACNDDYQGLQSRISFSATAGTTYYFMVGFCCGSGGNGGGSLTFSLDVLTPPGNDNFAAAAPFSTLPFSDTKDLSLATVESSEPSTCFGTSNTVWYAFTPTTTQSVTLSVDSYGAGTAVFTGSSLGSLTSIGCTTNQNEVFRATAGTTYHVQVGAFCCSGFGPVTFRAQVAPDPVASMYYYPSDPSSYDSVQFYDESYDPAGGQISAQAWNFGDGATATGCCPAHRFAQDGDYTVSLTVTTADGRSASTSQVVHVRTHDVTVSQVSVPSTAHVGQTVAINVYVQNHRYPETVRVDLSRSTPQGFQVVGSLTQSVPVRPPGGTSTKFAFSYTVTSADGLIGKVSFRAEATIVDHNDALSGDNVLISSPVKIV